MINIDNLDWLREHHPTMFAIVSAARGLRVPSQVVINYAGASLIVTLLLAFWGGHKDSEAERLRLEDKIVALEVKAQAIIDVENARHSGEAAQLRDLSGRLDVQRADLRALQEQINTHFDRPAAPTGGR